ncbi:LOW QUALITY PROTEIN: NADPH:adrenodoxin oxidoreductase, mitochondrial-like [Ornithodoros turicata]|uniref:LOW QUALITY PROTEIN: NADPH:adrenodoxin oxidoreductase, mitochondrial-like n=1 Tax=Ornithodoros turicata TaxID=34597 RepID=UPI00313863B6
MAVSMHRVSALRALKQFPKCHGQRQLSSHLKVCVVGAGPAGFYTAQQVLKDPNAVVDLYERMPVPFGLVRYGVAPDHPEVKNVIHTFTNTLRNSRCNFYGNVRLGKDVTLSDLRNAYHAVVLTYGSDEEKRLGIPGEDLSNIISARQFVGWYNGHPADLEVHPDLNVDTVAVIGHGNVALDVARILLTSPDVLQKTDISEPALCKLRKSTVKRVIVLGRRGPLQVSFTIKELREMTKLAGVNTIFRPEDFANLHKKVADLPRPRKRLVELMLQTAERTQTAKSSRSWELRFLRSPMQFLGNGTKVSGIELCINKLEEVDGRWNAVPVGDTETLDCQIVLKSIGYSSKAVDPAIPFDTQRSLVPNTGGRVQGLQGIYCSGWIKNWPVGVILTTLNCSFETASTLLRDAREGLLDVSQQRSGSEYILPLLSERGVKPLTKEHWLKIEAWEIAEGEKKGKPREKLLSVQRMLEIAYS